MEVEQYQSQTSSYSSEDEDAKLLTDKVEQKLLTTVAKLRAKDSSIYKIDKPIFQEQDFDSQEEKPVKVKDKKYTYKQQLAKRDSSQSEEEQQLPPAMEEAKARQSFKKAVAKAVAAKSDIFTLKQPNNSLPQGSEQEKMEQLIGKYDKQSASLIKSVWNDQTQMDQTDLFLKKYILDKKWLSTKHKKQSSEIAQNIDEQDQKRSIQMDEYQSQYNFRYQQPNSDKIVQFPRTIKQSVRLLPQTRKQKRKNLLQRKKQQQQLLKQQAQQRKKQLKEQILSRMGEVQEQDHDWFFCDDCARGLTQGQQCYRCGECEDYMLCEECFQLIIHKHPLNRESIPQGYGAPNNSADMLVDLKTCHQCRKKLPLNLYFYESRDRSALTLCKCCYQCADLSVKKKYEGVQPTEHNIVSLIEDNPQKVKELTNSKDVEEMVDEYMKYDYQGKTRFKYIHVPAESFGLSDQQILFGDDKELNNYVSIKKLAPYLEDKMRIRNNVYKKKIKGINKSVRMNEKIVRKGERKMYKTKLMKRMRDRAETMKKRREKKLKIVNISDPKKERNYMVSSSRLASYGLMAE